MKEKDKPKIVSINAKAEKTAQEQEEAQQEAIAELFSKVMEMTFEGHVKHAVVIIQGDESNTLLAAGDSSDLQLYKMYHYLDTKAAGDYNFGIKYIMGELEEYDE